MKHFTLALLLTTCTLSAQTDTFVKKVIRKFNFQPNCIALNKDNTLMVIGGENEKVVRYNLTTNKITNVLDAHYQPVTDVKFSNVHEGFYSIGDRSIKLWMPDEEKPKIVYTGKHTNITDWATTPEEDFFVISSYEKKIRFWYSESEDVPTIITTSQKKSIISVAVTDNKKTIATGSLDSTIELWDVESQNRKLKILAHSQPVCCLKFIEGGKYLLSASHDGYAKLWNTKTSENIIVYKGQGQAINAISISPNGKYMLAGTWDGIICLFAIPTGDLIFKFIHHKAPVWDLCWNNTGDGFYSCDKVGELVEWSVPKAIFVNFYFSKEINEKLNASKLFAPKSKDESRNTYKERQEKADNFKQEIIDKYYLQVLDKMVF